MKKKNRIILIVVLVCILVVMGTIICACDYTSPITVGELELMLSDDGTNYYVYNVPNKQVTEVVIPESYNNKPVTEIVNAFQNCENLVSLTIPNSITNIYESAFENCSSLESITIGEGVTEIGKQAFYGCNNLKTVYWNAKECFNSSDGFEELSITNVEIGEKVLSLPSRLFANCKELANVKISNSVKYIGRDAFENCDSLQYTEYNNALYLGNDENPYLVLVKAKSDNVTTVNINTNTKIIHSYAFDGCNNLQEVTVPNDILNVGEGAFPKSYNLNYNETNSGDLYLGNKDNPYLVLFEVDKMATQCTINPQTKFIHSGALQLCDITSITIPDSVVSIGVGAFLDCEELIDITIGNNVTRIEEAAFAGCISLKNVELPIGVEFIGDDAFSRCNDMESIIISDNVRFIGSGVFSNCSSLKTVYWNAKACRSTGHRGLNYFDGCSNFTTLEIGDGVTQIPNGAFLQCQNLKSVVFTNNVEEIGRCAFYECSGLTSVTISNSVTSIDALAFYDCNNLNEIKFIGTIKQWSEINKGYYWNKNVPAKKVICSDGEVKL